MWSAYGRTHPDTLTVLRSLSKSIARKRNIASAEVVFHRLHSSITLEIWRRNARQIRTCWPVTDLPAILDTGALSLDLALWLLFLACLLLCLLRALWFLSALLALAVLALLRICHGPPLAACHSGAPGAWPWRSLSHSICCHLCQRSFALFFRSLCRAFCGTMSRGDDLRRLAAQLTVLAELEDFVAVGISRVLGSAGTAAGLHAPQRPRLRPPRPFRSCPAMRLQRPCRAQQSPRQLPPGPAPSLALLCRCRSVLRGAAPAPSLLRVDPSPSLSRDWSRAWPSRAAHQSLPLSCASPVSLARLLQLRALRGLLEKPLRLLHQRKPLRLPAFQTLRPTLTAIGMPSSTHTASPRLPMSLQPPSPSRPTPLELVGALATSAAVACAKPPSAPCPRCVSHATWPALVASLAVVLVLDASTLLRIMGKSTWRGGHLHISEDHADALQDVGFSGAVGAGRGEDALGSHVLEFENSFVAATEVDSLETLRMLRSPTRDITIPESGCARQS